MARFRATVQGMRGGASRLGSKSSGLTVVANGWNMGITVIAYVDEDGNDTFTVLKTSGSSNRGESQAVATFTDRS